MGWWESDWIRVREVIQVWEYGQVLLGFAAHSKDVGFYTLRNRDPLENFTKRSTMI